MSGARRAARHVDAAPRETGGGGVRWPGRTRREPRLSRWDDYLAAALLAAFGAACAVVGVRLLTTPVDPVDPRFARRLARSSRLTDWLAAGPSRPRWLLRAVGVALVAAGLAILASAARLGAGP